MLRVAIALSAALATIPTYAQVFKCTDAAGGTEYRDGPCPAEASGKAVDIPAQTIPGTRLETGVPSETRTVRKHKREVVATYSFPGPRSIPRPQPVAALPPPPSK